MVNLQKFMTKACQRAKSWSGNGMLTACPLSVKWFMSSLVATSSSPWGVKTAAKCSMKISSINWQVDGISQQGTFSSLGNFKTFSSQAFLYFLYYELLGFQLCNFATFVFQHFPLTTVSAFIVELCL